MNMGILFAQKWERRLEALRASRAPGARARGPAALAVDARSPRRDREADRRENRCCSPCESAWRPLERV
jgi:hypothetical protein